MSKLVPLLGGTLTVMGGVSKHRQKKKKKLGHKKTQGGCVWVGRVVVNNLTSTTFLRPSSRKKKRNQERGNGKSSCVANGGVFLLCGGVGQRWIQPKTPDAAKQTNPPCSGGSGPLKRQFRTTAGRHNVEERPPPQTKGQGPNRQRWRHRRRSEGGRPCKTKSP